MKDAVTDANFPRTADGRVYHLGVRRGEVANRILTVGDPSRAKRVAAFLDSGSSSNPPHILQSERGFLTITGTYKGTPTSIVAIGMGIANMDFFVRECRECVDGDMAIIRLGSCGSLVEELPVGSFTIPKACVSITRNYDYDFTGGDSQPEQHDAAEPPYRISRPVGADSGLQSTLLRKAEDSRPETLADVTIRGDFINASADGFYSSQGRKTSFPDHNEGLIGALLRKVPGVATLEMETHHLFHLASVYPSAKGALLSSPGNHSPPILTREAGQYEILGQASGSMSSTDPSGDGQGKTSSGAIYAAGIQIIFAQRQSQAFIGPADVEIREKWAGRACLEALKAFELQTLHPDEGAVWTKP